MKYHRFKLTRNLAIIIYFVFSLFPIHALSSDGGQNPESQLKETESHYEYSDPVPMEDSGLRINVDPKGIYASEKFKSSDQPVGEKLKELYQEYKRQYFDLGLKSRGMVSVLFYNKINLNAIEDFKTLGVDLFELDKRQFEGMNNKERILYSKICITGTVVDSISNPDPKSSYHTLWKIKVDKIFKGSEYYKKIPEIINYYSPVGKVGNSERVMRPKFQIIDHIGERVCLGLVQYFRPGLELDSVSFDGINFMESEDFLKQFEEVNNSTSFFNEISK